MRDAAEYLAVVKAQVVAHPQVIQWGVVREEAKADQGLFRYCLTLRDGGILEMFERFQVRVSRVEVTRYSFHWQEATGALRKRWDNVPHHPELSTHPHHVHEGAEDQAHPHAPMTASQALAHIARSRHQQLSSVTAADKIVGSGLEI